MRSTVGPWTRQPTRRGNFLIHQKAEDGNDKLDAGMAPHLGVPADFADWHWAAQLNQARAIRYAVQHYRAWWPRTAGWILWQLNDCWPVTSWAAIDSAGRRKPLWHALQHAATPRVVSILERDGVLCAVLVNDTDEPWHASVQLRRESLSGRRFATQDKSATVAERSVMIAEIADEVRIFGDERDEVLIAEIDDLVACWTAVEDLELALDPAALTAVARRVDGGYRVDLQARSLVLDATILADRVAPDASVDDTLLSLPAGATASMFVATAADLDPEVLTRAPVLRSANDLRAVAIRSVPGS